jgi:S-adenosylmethionine synthetase
MYKFFHVNYSTSEIKAKSDQLKKQHPDAIVESNTDRVLSDFIKDKIYDTLIYEHFVNVFKINITDEEVRRFLQDYYEKTNTSIQSILNDPKQTSRIKNELTFAKLLREFSEKFRVKYLG